MLSQPRVARVELFLPLSEPVLVTFEGICVSDAKSFDECSDTWLTCADIASDDCKNTSAVVADATSVRKYASAKMTPRETAETLHDGVAVRGRERILLGPAASQFYLHLRRRNVVAIVQNRG